MVEIAGWLLLSVYEVPTHFNKFLYWQTSASLGLVSLKSTSVVHMFVSRLFINLYSCKKGLLRVNLLVYAFLVYVALAINRLVTDLKHIINKVE